jgi:hypothetical protein
VTTGSSPFEDGVITTAGTVILSFHALNGLVILGVAVVLVRKAYALAFPKRAVPADADEPERVPAATP